MSTRTSIFAIVAFFLFLATLLTAVLGRRRKPLAILAAATILVTLAACLSAWSGHV